MSPTSDRVSFAVNRRQVDTAIPDILTLRVRQSYSPGTSLSNSTERVFCQILFGVEQEKAEAPLLRPFDSFFSYWCHDMSKSDA